MKFRKIRKFRKNSVDKPKNRGEKRAGKFGRKIAGVALAAFLGIMPFVEGKAMAQDTKPVEPAAAAEMIEEKAAEETKAEEEVEKDKLVRYNVVFPPAPSRYDDPALSPFQDTVEVGGEPRKMARDNPIDLGVNFLANEAGEAAFGTFRYRNLARFDTGVLSFRGPLAPFGRVMLRPELHVR